MKKIKFPLEMAQGKMVRSLDEFRQYFDLELALEYFNNGKLQKWLENYYNDDIVAELESLDFNQEHFLTDFLDALGIENHVENIEVSSIIQKIRLKEALKKELPEEQLEKCISYTANTQERLETLIQEATKTIYLTDGTFYITKEAKNITFIGLFQNAKIHLEEQDRQKFLQQNLHFEKILPADETTRLLLHCSPLETLMLEVLDLLQSKIETKED